MTVIKRLAHGEFIDPTFSVGSSVRYLFEAYSGGQEKNEEGVRFGPPGYKHIEGSVTFTDCSRSISWEFYNHGDDDNNVEAMHNKLDRAITILCAAKEALQLVTEAYEAEKVVIRPTCDKIAADLEIQD